MKKFIAIIASIALACTLAFTVTSCGNDVDKAYSYVEKAISAAKKGDVDAFQKAIKDGDKLKLSEKDNAKLQEKLKKLPAEDIMLLSTFAMQHAGELDLD